MNPITQLSDNALLIPANLEQLGFTYQEEPGTDQRNQPVTLGYYRKENFSLLGKQAGQDVYVHFGEDTIYLIKTVGALRQRYKEATGKELQ